MSMLDVLHQVEAEIAQLVEDVDGWQSMHVTYHPPEVERLWRPWRDDYRVNLHRIHPCAEGEALYHPHPWPSAMRLLSGRYQMGIGTHPTCTGTIILTPGSEYSMGHIDAWHYVRPLTVTYSLMVTGKPWILLDDVVKPTEKQGPLSDAKKVELLDEFARILRPKTMTSVWSIGQ